MTAADREARARELLVQEYEREGILGGVSTDASHIDRAAIRAITRAMQPQPAGEGAVACHRLVSKHGGSTGWIDGEYVLDPTADIGFTIERAYTRAALAAMPSAQVAYNPGAVLSKDAEAVERVREDAHAWEDCANFHKERADALQAALTKIEAQLRAAIAAMQAGEANHAG